MSETESNYPSAQLGKRLQHKSNNDNVLMNRTGKRSEAGEGAQRQPIEPFTAQNTTNLDLERPVLMQIVTKFDIGLCRSVWGKLKRFILSGLDKGWGM